MTTVTATVTDTGGQSWNGGAWFATLVTKPGFVNPNNGYLVGGSQVPNQGGIGGLLDGTGSFSTSLTPNDTIGPAGSVWRFQVVSQASSTSFVAEVAITGVSQDISVQLTPPAIRVNMQVPALAYIAYTDAEVVNANIGQTYWNVTSQKMRVCTTAPSTWADLGGTAGAITGTIAATQIAFGSGANTITGSNNLEYIPASGGEVITTSNVGPANVTGAGIAMANSGGGTTLYIGKKADGTFFIQNDGQLIPAHGLLRWDANSNCLLESGSNGPQLTLYTGASISPYGPGSAVLELFNTGGGTHLFSVHGNTGAGDAGAITLDPFNSRLTIYGDTSGSASIQTAAAAGSPNPLQLPLTTGTSGQLLSTDGGNPQQMSWTNVVPFVAAPSTAGSAGTTGQVAFDATHFYVCIATNTWVRGTLASF